MTTPIAQTDDGWIAHTGGRCPLKAFTLIDAEIRNGDRYMGYKACRVPGHWARAARPRFNDIIAYRLVKP